MSSKADFHVAMGLVLSLLVPSDLGQLIKLMWSVLSADRRANTIEAGL